MSMKIYVAGPDVFRRDGVEVLENKKNICEQYGYIGITPFDKQMDFSRKNSAIRQDIYKNNIQYIKECDIVIADLNNFRHNEQDSGTIFEIGFATALNKKIIFYSSDKRTLLEKTVEAQINHYTTDGNQVFDDNDMEIENFDGQFNLMINESGTFIHGTFEDAIKYLAEQRK